MPKEIQIFPVKIQDRKPTAFGKPWDDVMVSRAVKFFDDGKPDIFNHEVHRLSEVANHK